MGKDLKGRELGKNLSQRKDGRYEARYTDNFGKRHSIYGKKLKDVRKKLNEAVYEKEHNIIHGNCMMTADEWFRVWVNTYKATALRSTTLARIYRYYESHIKNEIGFLNLNHIKPFMIQELYNKCVKQGLSRDTVMHIHSLLKNMFKQALFNGYITYNPCDGTEIKIKSEVKKHRVLSFDEQKLFMLYAKKTRYFELFQLMLLTGMRIGEILALTWNDVDFINRYISVNKTCGLLYASDIGLMELYSTDAAGKYKENKRYIHEPKTKESNRKIPLCSKAVNILSNLRKRDNCDLVFYTETGMPILRSNINSAIRRIVKNINKDYPEKEFQKFSAHTFRHTFATRCFEAGIPHKTVQHILGHTSIRMTMDLYTHVSEENKLCEIDKINNIL